MNRIRGYLLALGSTLVISNTGILIKYILTRYGLHPETLAFWRAFIISAVMLIGIRFSRPRWLHLDKRDVPYFLAYGLLGVALSQALWTLSVSLNGAALSTMLGYVAPAFVTIFARFFFKEPITLAKGVALALTLLGVALIARAYDPAQLKTGWLGVLVGVSAGATYGSYTLFAKEANARYHPLAAMAYAFAFGALFLAPLQRLGDISLLGQDSRGWGLIALLALGPTMGGYGLYTLSLRDLPASVAGLIQPLEVVFASAIAFVVFGERLQLPQWVGAALILASVVLLHPREESKRI